MKRSWLILLPLLHITLVACSGSPTKTTAVEGRFELELAQDSSVQVGDHAPIEKKTGEKVVAESLPVLVESPGHVGLLIAAPTSGSSQDLKIKLRPIDSFGGPVFNQKVNAAVTEIVSRVTEIQILLAAGKANQAFEKFSELEMRYQDVHWLGFLKTSCLIAKGEFGHARSVLEMTLKEYPRDPSGERLLQILSKEQRR